MSWDSTFRRRSQTGEGVGPGINQNHWRTIQVSRRVKGTEKFWSSEGGEAVLQLRGDYLSDSEPMESHWLQPITKANGFRAYELSG